MDQTIQIKIFRCTEVDSIERMINDWIKENSSAHIIDVKYMFDNSYVGLRRIAVHCAVVTYEADLNSGVFY